MNLQEFQEIMSKKGQGDQLIADFRALADEITAAAAPSPYKESAEAAANELRDAASRLVAAIIRAELAFRRAEKKEIDKA